MSDSDDYNKAFEGEFLNEDAVLIRAFEKAVDTRKFEIDLYWKRAGYFWALIAVAFAGYFAAQTVNTSTFDRRLFSFTIASAGFFFTLAWFLVNKGSKFWQENWENHVALLGRQIVGPLFEWVFERSGWKPVDIIVGPARFSVTRVNQWVSFYLMLVWLFLMSLAAKAPQLTCLATLQRHPYRLLSFLTAAMSLSMLWGSRTNLDRHTPKLIKMSTRIRD